MPFGQGYSIVPYNRKTTITRRRNTKRVPTVGAVRKMINYGREQKMKTVSLPTLAPSVSTTWTEIDMSDIDVGDTLEDRDGRQVLIRQLAFNGVLNVADTTNVMRIVIALWDSASQTPLQTNGATIHEVIANNVVAGTGLVKKYYDKYFTFVSTQDSALRKFNYNKYWKKGLRIVYQGNTGADARRKLVFSIISDSGAVTHPGFTIGHGLTRYNDC